jgi:hypothetical protein
MLIEEKHNKNSVAFRVDIGGGANKENKEPEIKKRLELSAKAAKGPSITQEKISEKLNKAEQKRK